MHMSKYHIKGFSNIFLSHRILTNEYYFINFNLLLPQKVVYSCTKSEITNFTSPWSEKEKKTKINIKKVYIRSSPYLSLVWLVINSNAPLQTLTPTAPPPPQIHHHQKLSVLKTFVPFFCTLFTCNCSPRLVW